MNKPGGIPLSMALLGVCAASLIGLLTYNWMRPVPAGKDELADFCIKTRLSLHQDARDLVDPKRQEIAFARFYESDIMYHNAESLLMCAPDVPFDTREFSRCWLEKNYACLAGLATFAESAVARRR